MAATPLCQLAPAPPKGCCEQPQPPPAAPIMPFNQPGLSAIRYRIGTFTSFRQAMIDRVPQLPQPNPFAQWQPGSYGDYHTMLIELWAYLADILTFYQERIANEAFLPTATQRDSLMRLAELIAYRANPGAAAGALVSFTVENGKTLTIPASFRVGTRAAPGKPAAVFETEAAIVAHGESSAIPLSDVAPTNQFAPLAAYGSLFGGLTLANAVVAASNLYGNFGSLLLQTLALNTSTSGTSAQATASATTTSASFASTALSSSSFASISSSPLIANFVPRFVYRPFVNTTTRTVVLRGISTRLAAGDHVLVIEHEGEAGEKATLRQLSSVTANRAGNTTTITWSEPAGASYDNDGIKLYALRVKAGAFGNSAPQWSSLPPTLTNTVNGVDGSFKDKNWDSRTKAGNQLNEWFFLPTPGDPGNLLFLDSTYDDATGTSDRPGWVALVGDDRNAPGIFRITEARPVSKANYTISSRVTRLTLNGHLPANTFPLRDTVILTGAEELALENNLPLPDPLAGRTLILAGLHGQLQDGQTVILRGTLFHSDPPLQNAEVGRLDGPPVVDATNGITTVTLQQALAKQYVRAGTALLTNVVDVTQGETVRDEILGSGNGGAFQIFPLKKKPLTYLPATDPEGLSAVESTLLVTVNGVRWQERPTLVDSQPDAQAYSTTLDDSGQTAVVFGDGVNGARPPTGRDNIRAHYRKGLGTSGNVATGAIEQLIDSTPGLQKVTNPQPSLGGADQESVDQIRTNAPNSLRTFGRAVSAKDYAALALSFPGVAKASAAWMLRDATLKAIPQPFIQLTIATTDGLPLAGQPTLLRNLRAFLDGRRDPNVSLRIGDFTPVFVDVAATIEVDDRFGRQATYQQALAALNPGLNPDGSAGFFAFERLQFGQSIHLSAVYSALQAVPGVRAATVTTLRRPDIDHDLSTVRDDILIRPTELAIVRNDPADVANQFGKLTLTLGQGGFIDV